MDINFKARALWNTGKQLSVSCTRALSTGVSFDELFTLYTSYVRVIVPSAIESAVDYVVAYFLFHFYLAYILVFTVSWAVMKRFKTKGGGIAPLTGALKEKAGLFLTYFFVAQSLSTWTFGWGSMPALERVVGWAFRVKPQINFKPQIKIGKTKSNESVVSVKSKMDTALHVGLESDDEDVRKNMKSLKKVQRGVDFATEMADAVLMGQSDEEDNLEVPDTSIEECPVQKWLADTTTPEDVRLRVMRLVAENESMRKASMHRDSN